MKPPAQLARFADNPSLSIETPAKQTHVNNSENPVLITLASSTTLWQLNIKN